jgi:hypothetical protein
MADTPIDLTQIPRPELSDDKPSIAVDLAHPGPTSIAPEQAADKVAE